MYIYITLYTLNTRLYVNYINKAETKTWLSIFYDLVVEIRLFIQHICSTCLPWICDKKVERLPDEWCSYHMQWGFGSYLWKSEGLGRLYQRTHYLSRTHGIGRNWTGRGEGHSWKRGVRSRRPERTQEGKGGFRPGWGTLGFKKYGKKGEVVTLRGKRHLADVHYRFLFVCLGLYLWHMEIPRLGV